MWAGSVSKQLGDAATGALQCSNLLTQRSTPLQGFGIRHMLNPNPYHGAFGNDGKKYAEDVQDVISTCTPGGVAGFIAETIQGVGGSVPLADGYLPTAYEVSNSHAKSALQQLLL